MQRLNRQKHSQPELRCKVARRGGSMKLRKSILGAALMLMAPGAAVGQVPPPMACNVSAAPPPILRSEGKAELVSDIILLCSGGIPTAPAVVNLSVFLNTNITSNLTGPGPDETEALVLIDEPKPAPTLNNSNGFSFVGQVKGTAAVIASGNVFTGLRTGAVNQIIFLGLPIVPPGPGTRTLRITNLRVVPPPPA